MRESEELAVGFGTVDGGFDRDRAALKRHPVKGEELTECRIVEDSIDVEYWCL